jgi:siroheme synthase (precorrin-2 oxidase/ferrochelatase)
MNSIIPQHAKAALEEDAKVRAEVRRRFEREKKPEGFWQRLVSWWKFEREVRKEMKRRFPPGAFYSR